MDRIFIGQLPEGMTGWTPMVVNSGDVPFDLTLAPGAGIYVPAVPGDTLESGRDGVRVIDLSLPLA